MKRLWTAGALVAVLALAGCGGAGTASTETGEETDSTSSASAGDAQSGADEQASSDDGVELSAEGHQDVEGPAYTVRYDDDYRTVVTTTVDQLAELTQGEVTEDSVDDVLAVLSEADTYAEHAELADYADELAGAAESSEELGSIITRVADGSAPTLRIAVSHAVQNVSVSFGTQDA